ncbi:MAG: hypothetical protein WBV45_06810 [Lutimonas sp.]
MKKLTFFFALVLFFQTTQGQITDSLTTEINQQTNQEMYDYLMAKHKKQKKAGLIMIGSGVLATVGGILLTHNSSLADSEWTAGALLAYAGVLTTISSIPVLIISGSNKRKAETYLQVGRHRMIDMNLPNTETVTLGVKIKF